MDYEVYDAYYGNHNSHSRWVKILIGYSINCLGANVTPNGYYSSPTLPNDDVGDLVFRSILRRKFGINKQYKCALCKKTLDPNNNDCIFEEGIHYHTKCVNKLTRQQFFNRHFKHVEYKHQPEV